MGRLIPHKIKKLKINVFIMFILSMFKGKLDK